MSGITTAYLTNGAYGRRTAPPSVLLVLHVTGNPTNQRPNAATNERTYANRDYPKLPNGDTDYSGAASAHYYINRDGSGVHAIDEGRDYAWSNGVVRKPSANAAKLITYPEADGGANGAARLEIECVGYATSAGQPTDAQLDTVARLVAPWVARDRLSVDRTTVLGHFDVDSVDRASCPFMPIEHGRMDAVISRIKALVAPEEEEAVGFHSKPGGPMLGTFILGEGHDLLSTEDPAGTRYAWPAGAKLAVYAVENLVDRDGKPIDIDGHQPPRNDRDQVYRVDGVTPSGKPFGAGAWALRADGAFAPAEPAEVASVTVTYVDGRSAVLRTA